MSKLGVYRQDRASIAIKKGTGIGERAHHVAQPARHIGLCPTLGVDRIPSPPERPVDRQT
jgi:hypothetical protein